MIARVLYYASFAVITVTVSVAGVRMWHDAHHAPRIPAAVALAPTGYVAVAADRHTLSRAGAWSVVAPAAIDTLDVAGALVMGKTVDATAAALHVFALDTGALQFTFALPPDERWAVPAPTAIGPCVLAQTLRAGDMLVRCIDPSGGHVRWAATILGGRECTRAPAQVSGAFLVQCEGWTSIIDAASGTVTAYAGGISLVQTEPALLLHAGVPLELVPWNPAERKFAARGERVTGTDEFISTSAVMHGDRLVVRATSSSDQIALISPRVAAPTVVAAQGLHLADEEPLVLECGGATSPRFQLLALSAQLGEKFDPTAASQRRLALLDVERGAVTWTSKPVEVVRELALCRQGRYVVQLVLRGADGALFDALWAVDAETGKTARVLRFDPQTGATFGDLTAAQIDANRVVAIGKDGAMQILWSAATLPPGVHDARAELAALLGPLP